MTRLRNEEGGVTAEFAIVIPAILLVIGVVIGGLVLGATRITLVSAAHDIARLEARGDTRLASSRAAELPGEATISRNLADGILCITIEAAPGRGILSQLVVSGYGCAAHSEGVM